MILDDEIGAIRNLEWILRNHSDVELVASAQSTKEAELKIKLLRPDILFLDIEMPSETGISFLERLGIYDFEVVFVTAYNEFAIKAFKLNALDYLLKPIDIAELKNCIIRISETLLIKQQMREHLLKEQIRNLSNVKDINNKDKIILKTKEGIEIVPFDKIISISADGAYSMFNFLVSGIQKKLLMSYSLAYYEELLPSEYFLRVHKSFIVNKNFIHSIEREPNYFIITNLNERIPISKRRVNEILHKL